MVTNFAPSNEQWNVSQGNDEIALLKETKSIIENCGKTFEPAIIYLLKN